MEFFVDYAEITPADIEAQFKAYDEYLQSIKDSLPSSAFSFAAASWHYNPDDHRCPHDSWVESLTIKELSSGERHQFRTMELHLRLLGAYHDGWIEITYEGLQGYSLNTPGTGMLAQSAAGHGDWLNDEVRLSERGLVQHEIKFSHGVSWLIECEDLMYRWIAVTER